MKILYDLIIALLAIAFTVSAAFITAILISSAFYIVLLAATLILDLLLKIF